jgi:hypothetical protein
MRQNLKNWRKMLKILEQRVEALAEKLVNNNKELHEMKQTLQKTEYLSSEGVRLGNLNERYSRKHNFKIMGLQEKDRENTWKVVQDLLKHNVRVELGDREIVAAHILVKFSNAPANILHCTAFLFNYFDSNV